MSYVIIGIHGLKNKPSKEALRKGWVDAIQEGLRRNLRMSPDPIHFELVYWADLLYEAPLDPDPQPYVPAPGSDPLKTYKDSWLDEIGADILGAAGSVLDATKKWLGFHKSADKILEERARDLSKYYEEPETRKRLRSRLADALLAATGERIMLIGHSMGSIIAYDVLRGASDSDPAVAHFVTLGSPLGLPHVKYKIHEEWGDVRTPSGVQRWTNFADRRDSVALDAHLADDYEAHDGVRVVDDLVINGYRNREGDRNSHKIYGYLRAPEVSAVIGEFI